jgi:hypothetical protein
VAGAGAGNGSPWTTGSVCTGVTIRDSSGDREGATSGTTAEVGAGVGSATGAGVSTTGAGGGVGAALSAGASPAGASWAKTEEEKQKLIDTKNKMATRYEKREGTRIIPHYYNKKDAFPMWDNSSKVDG